MTTRNRQPPTLTGCDVLPPMDSGKAKPANAREPKQKSDKRNAGNRFAVLNAFVDCTAGGLSRGEILVGWCFSGTCETALRRHRRQTSLAESGGPTAPCDESSGSWNSVDC